MPAHGIGRRNDFITPMSAVGHVPVWYGLIINIDIIMRPQVEDYDGLVLLILERSRDFHQNVHKFFYKYR